MFVIQRAIKTVHRQQCERYSAEWPILAFSYYGSGRHGFVTPHFTKWEKYIATYKTERGAQKIASILSNIHQNIKIIEIETLNELPAETYIIKEKEND